jgi:hypothetical protein
MSYLCQCVSASPLHNARLLSETVIARGLVPLGQCLYLMSFSPH